MFTDHNIAAFLIANGNHHNYKPHIKKGIIASIGSALQRHELVGIYERKSVYPKVHLMKIEPYFPASASNFPKVYLSYVLAMENKCCRDYSDKVKKIMNIIFIFLTISLVFFVWTCFSSMRKEDVYTMYSKDVTVSPHTKEAPRRYKALIEKTKNDINGSGPIDGRTFIIPCFCAHNCEQSSKTEVVKWIKACRLNSTGIPTDCITYCPFQVITDYLSRIPDSSGAIRERDILLEEANWRTLQDSASEGSAVGPRKAEMASLKFMRALTLSLKPASLCSQWEYAY